MKKFKYLFNCEMAEEVATETVVENTVAVEGETVKTENPEEQITTDTQQETTVDTNEEKSVQDNSELEKIIEQMKAENEKLKADLNSKGKEVEDLSKVQEELNSLKNSKETVEQKVSTYEKALTDIIEAKLSDVPEIIKSLMPQNASLTEKLEWINKAEQGGIIKKEIEIGKPMNPSKPVEHIDTANLSTAALMALAYGSKK